MQKECYAFFLYIQGNFGQIIVKTKMDVIYGAKKKYCSRYALRAENTL